MKNSSRVYSVLVVKTDLEGELVKKRASSSCLVVTSKQVFDKVSSSMSVKHCVCARVTPNNIGDGVDRNPPVDFRGEMAKIEAI